MKRMHLTAALLAVLLAACRAAPAAPAPTAAPAATAPPTAAPTAAPTPAPTPDPAAALTYETLPVRVERQPLAGYESATRTFMPDDEQARRAGYELAAGLYNADAGRVRAALSARVTAQGSGLEDLEGLQVVDVQLEGGRYEVPYLYLTVADPGSTALLPGEHVYNIEFDEQGRVDWLSPFGMRRGGDVLLRDNLDFTEQDGVRTASGVRISGQPADPLGLTLQAVTGETLRYHFTVAPDGAAGEEIIDEQTPLPGNWPLPLCSEEGYETPPDGNEAELGQAALAQVAEELNVLFAALLDGSYQAAEFSSGPALDALRAWDPARPLPVAVTPGVLRTDWLASPNPDIRPVVRVWVPLPQSCWAVFTLDEDGHLIAKANYALTPPPAAQGSL